MGRDKLKIGWLARSTSAAILACALGAPALAQSRQHLPEPLDLRISASVAAKEGRVLLVLFSETGCMFCEHLRREVLLPMQRNADLRKKIEFFQVDVDAPKSLRDFAGIESTQKELARRYRIRIMPTVLLLGPQGEILAEPLVGFNGSDFYGAYLDERIETARGKLSTRRAVPK